MTTPVQPSLTKVQRLLHVLTLILRIIFWPIIKLSYYFFPSSPSDGPAPTAAHQFVQYLQTLGLDNDAAKLWNIESFAQTQQAAIQSEHALVVFIYSPLQTFKDEFMTELWVRNKEVHSFLSQVTAIGLSCHTGAGAHLANRLNLSAYPALYMLEPPPATSSSNRQKWQLAYKIEGYSLDKMVMTTGMPSVSTMLQYLQASHHATQLRVSAARARKIEQEQAQLLRQQQDAEYEETLRADQLREEARRKEEEREREIMQAQLEKEAHAQEALKSAQSKLRPAPEAGGTMVRFVLPSGQKLNRRFHNNDSIGVLHAYLKLHFHENDIGIKRVALSTNFPRKTYTDEGVTLDEAGLYPQAVLMVQDLDA